MANGTDSVRNYNGAAWSTPTLTGVTSANLSFVWSHKRSLWFVEKNTLSAWYLPVNSIAGTVAEFPLDGVFKLGGALLFGGTWSLDSGDGLDDVMLFITTEGEVAVYQGTDPGSDFQLSGVYRIGKPLNKHGWFRAGGDLCILTRDGIVPVSEALRKDVAALQAAAITFPIEDLWQQAIAAAASGTFPAIKRHFSVLRCNHCTKAPCVTICPVNALEKRSDGIVDIDRDACWPPDGKASRT
jgi:ferredoxin